MVFGTATDKSNISISESVFSNAEVLESQFKLEHSFPQFVLPDHGSIICNSYAQLLRKVGGQFSDLNPMPIKKTEPKLRTVFKE
jgi:hypothetical protein